MNSVEIQENQIIITFHVEHSLSVDPGDRLTFTVDAEGIHAALDGHPLAFKDESGILTLQPKDSPLERMVKNPSPVRHCVECEWRRMGPDGAFRGQPVCRRPKWQAATHLYPARWVRGINLCLEERCESPTLCGPEGIFWRPRLTFFQRFYLLLTTGSTRPKPQ